MRCGRVFGLDVRGGVCVGALGDTFCFAALLDKRFLTVVGYRVVTARVDARVSNCASVAPLRRGGGAHCAWSRQTGDSLTLLEQNLLDIGTPPPPPYTRRKKGEKNRD